MIFGAAAASSPDRIDASLCSHSALATVVARARESEMEPARRSASLACYLFDLPFLERQYVKPGGHQIEIELAADGTKKAETEFRRRLKEFTSGAKPMHCLVQAIEITSPAPILKARKPASIVARARSLMPRGALAGTPAGRTLLVA